MKIKELLETIWKQRILGLFFIVALLLWYITKLSNQYTTDILIPVEIVPDIDDSRWIENPELKVNTNCQLDGRTILSYRLNIAASIKIPISKIALKKVDRYSYSISHESLSRAIQAQIKDININYINDSVQVIRVADNVSKKVPIIPKIIVSYAPQHMNPNGKVLLDFDSVEIKAPKIILDTINYIQTEENTYENLNHTIKSNISLKIPKRVACRNHSVPYEISVERCTQYKFTIDVATSHNNYMHRINSGDNKKITVIPKQVTIFLNMPLSAETQKNEIRAYIDYQESDNRNQYEVKLDKLPVGSEIVAIEPRYVNIFTNR